MPRKNKVYWHPGNGRWAYGGGDVGAAGRRKPVYLDREIPNTPAGRRAASAEMERRLAAREERVIVGDTFTLDMLRKLYLSHSKKTAAPNTYHGHRKALAKFTRFAHAGKTYGAVPARAFTATDLDRAVKEWVRAGHRPTYVVRVCSSVQAMLNWSAEPVPGREPERLIPANPVKGYRPRDLAGQPVVIPHAPEQYATNEEIRAFLAFCWRRAKGKAALESRFDRLTALLIRFAAMTGCRPGEVCRVRWDEIDWDDRIVEQKTGKTVKRTGRSRKIALTPEAARILRRVGRLKDHHPEFVFTHRRGPRSGERGAGVREWGEPWNSNALSRKVKDLRREAIAAGVPVLDAGDNRFRMYRLRHTKASDDLMGGGDPVTVAALLGTSPKMLHQRYGHLLHGHLTAAAADLAARAKAARKKGGPGGGAGGRAGE